MYLEFTLSQTLEQFLNCHQNAFRAFGAVPKNLMYDYVPGNIIRIMWPPPLCGSSLLDTVFSRRTAAPRAHNDHSDFSHSRSAWSSRQMGFRGCSADASVGGSQASSACAFMRRVISA